MLYLENNTTFSGSDIKVYAYRSASDFNNFIDLDERKVKKANTDPLYPDDPFRDMTAEVIENNLSDKLNAAQSGRIFTEKTWKVTMTDGSVKILGDKDFNRFLANEDLSNYSHAEEAGERLNTESVHTNKINPNYVDIVRTGSDKGALKVARDYQLAQQRAFQNNKVNKDGSLSSDLKPIIELGSLYSITYSSFREKHAVRTLGRVSAKAYTRGQRTIAGSMNFAVFQSHELMDFLKTGENASQIVILDQLPKFNLMLVMINEYGGASILHLFGVTISTESQQTSVEDLALMNNVTFYAEDIMTIEDVGNVFETSLSMLHPTVLAGKTLRFYKKDSFTTLGSLMSINGDRGRNSKIDALINKSRGLF